MDCFFSVEGLRLCYVISDEASSLQLAYKLAQDSALNVAVSPGHQYVHVSASGLSSSKRSDCFDLVMRVSSGNVEESLLYELKHLRHFLARNTLLEFIDVF